MTYNCPNTFPRFCESTTWPFHRKPLRPPIRALLPRRSRRLPAAASRLDLFSPSSRVVILFMVFRPGLRSHPGDQLRVLPPTTRSGDNIASIDLQGLKITGEFIDPPAGSHGQDRPQGEASQAGQEIHDHPSGHCQPRTLDELILDEAGGQVQGHDAGRYACTSCTCFPWSGCRC